jgi:hypothetical protein
MPPCARCTSACAPWSPKGPSSASTRPTSSTSASCPCCFADASDYDRIHAGDRIACDDLHKLLEGGGDLVNTTQGYRFEVKTALTERQRRILLDGGLLRHVAAAAGAGEGA